MKGTLRTLSTELLIILLNEAGVLLQPHLS
jgi:hypothetical protein